MGQILLRSQNPVATLVSNDFIDNCMDRLNEAQLKIYLFLLRHAYDSLQPSVCGIADHFNYTEKDVERALSYMKKLGLLSSEGDGASDSDRLRSQSSGMRPADPTAIASSSQSPASGRPASDASGASASAGMSKGMSDGMSDGASGPDHFYPADRVTEFREREDVKQLLYITEIHLNKDLSLAETNTLLFIYDQLHFSIDLIEYLVEYCVNCGKKSLRYIERVALAWADEGVTTVEEAKARVSGSHYRECYAMLRELGITSRSPVRSDMEYLNKWIDGYHLDFEVVLEACRRNITSISKPSFSYIDTILRRWKNDGVHHVSDIAASDERYRASIRTTAGRRAPASAKSANKFRNFQESGRDFNAIAHDIMSSQAPL